MLKITEQKPSTIRGLIIAVIALVALLTGAYTVSVMRSHFANAAADGFEAGRIIDDSIFTNKNSMNVGQIQNFLNSKNPTCDTNGTQPSEFNNPSRNPGYTRAMWAADASLHPVMGAFYPPFTCMKDYSQNGRSAAQIIYDVSQQYNINPQVLIVLLQKEQSLVTDTWPSPTQYKSATGYNCTDSAPCDPAYAGFTNQVTWAAKMFNAIMTASPTWYTPYVTGNNFIRYNPNTSCGGSNVYIQNRATQALYNYTPYQPNNAALDANMGVTVNCGAYGNLNFYRYYKSWFGTTKGIPYDWSVVSQRVYSDAGMTQVINDVQNVTNLNQGQKAYVQMKIKNTGAEIWNKNTIKLESIRPNDRGSAMWSPTWLSGNRIAFIAEDEVRPGDVGTFNFEVVATQTLGSYTEYVRPIFDGIARFPDIGAYNTFRVNFRLPDGARTSLAPGQSLTPGQSLYSTNGYRLDMQGDGNLVIYNRQNKAVWGSGTDRNVVSGVFMQGDGNLVIYAANGKALWGTGTDRNGPSRLDMQSDGNLVIYSASRATWGSNTVGR